MHVFKCIKQQEDSVTAVEFSLLTVIFMLLFFAIVEFSIIMYTSAVLKGAASFSARVGKTGYTVEDESLIDMIYELI
jgi:Flp pilus assembly protein TadG